MKPFYRYDWLKFKHLERCPYVWGTPDCDKWNKEDDRRMLLIALDCYAEYLEYKMEHPTIENNFKYHAPTPNQIEKYKTIRDKAKELALLTKELSPPSREQSTAFTKLEEYVMWTNAAIARNE